MESIERDHRHDQHVGGDHEMAEEMLPHQGLLTVKRACDARRLSHFQALARPIRPTRLTQDHLVEPDPSKALNHFPTLFQFLTRAAFYGPG
jgi:hypothetical protein